MIPHIVSPTSQTVTFYLDGKRESVGITDARYDKVMHSLAIHDDEGLKHLLSISPDTYLEESASKVILTYKELHVLELANKDKMATFRGVKLARSVADMILRQISEGVTSFAHIECFLEKLIQIKDKFVAEQLYSFLEKSELPITEKGTFIAYKGVKADGYSCHGNTSTRVLTGEVDDRGHILNTDGAYISVERADVDTDPNRHCSTGLHVGSYEYASGYGRLLLYVEVDPLDVVSVPSDCDEKCRVCAYKVLSGALSKAKGPSLRKAEEHALQRVLSEDKVHKIVSDSNLAAKYKDSIRKYVETKKEEATVAKLRRSVGRKFGLTTDEMFRLCISLGFSSTPASHLSHTVICL